MKSSDEKNQIMKTKLTFLLTFFIFSVVAVVFSILCLNNTEIAFLKRYEILFSWLSTLLICLLFAFSVWFLFTNKETLMKSLFSLYILLDFALIVLFVLRETSFFEVIKDAQALQDWLKKAGVWMPIAYIVLQYLQVVILPIPSFVSTAAGVALFGPFKAMIYSFVGIILGSLTAFYIGRKLGSKAVAWMVGQEVLEKWQGKLKGKDNFLLTVMFLLPFFPDDVLCFVAGLSTMPEKYFFIMILVTRLIAVSSTSYSLNFIPLTTWWGLLIWAVLIIVVGIVVVVLYKNLEKVQAWSRRIFKNGEKRK